MFFFCLTLLISIIIKLYSISYQERCTTGLFKRVPNPIWRKTRKIDLKKNLNSFCDAQKKASQLIKRSIKVTPPSVANPAAGEPAVVSSCNVAKADRTVKVPSKYTYIFIQRRKYLDCKIRCHNALLNRSFVVLAASCVSLCFVSFVIYSLLIFTCCAGV
jgi:hypothetical protein